MHEANPNTGMPAPYRPSGIGAGYATQSQRLVDRPPQPMVGPTAGAPVGGQAATPATPRAGELATATPPTLLQRPAVTAQDADAPGRSASDQEPTGPAFSPARAAVSDCLKDIDLTHDKDSQFAQCYEAGLSEQDARLNREFNKEKGSAANSGRVPALTAAQRAWISFRDSWCTYEAGSGQAPSPQVDRLSCLFDLTLDQADRLADSYRPD